MKIYFFSIFILFEQFLSTEIYNIDIYGKYVYSAYYETLSVFNISDFKEDKIYVTYETTGLIFMTENISYDFSDDYPLETSQPQTIVLPYDRQNYSSYINTTKRYESKLFFSINKENKKYLIIENLPCKEGENITIENIETPGNNNTLIAVSIFIVVIIIVTFIILAKVFSRKRRFSTINTNALNSLSTDSPVIEDDKDEQIKLN